MVGEGSGGGEGETYSPHNFVRYVLLSIGFGQL